MNGRIKELYDQCWFGGFGDDITVYQKDSIISESIGYCFDSQKFAELIVKECISVLEEKIYQSIDNDGDEVWTDLILKEHFGVEE